jgi:hypothetical protein
MSIWNVLFLISMGVTFWRSIWLKFVEIRVVTLALEVNSLSTTPNQLKSILDEYAHVFEGSLCKCDDNAASKLESYWKFTFRGQTTQQKSRSFRPETLAMLRLLYWVRFNTLTKTNHTTHAQVDELPLHGPSTEPMPLRFVSVMMISFKKKYILAITSGPILGCYGLYIECPTGLFDNQST